MILLKQNAKSINKGGTETNNAPRDVIILKGKIYFYYSAE